MTSKPKEKPLGMRIGENAFCIVYLVFALPDDGLKYAPPIESRTDVVLRFLSFIITSAPVSLPKISFIVISFHNFKYWNKSEKQIFRFSNLF